MEAGLHLLRAFLRDHPAEAAQELEHIPVDEASAVLADAPPDEGAPVLAAMGVDAQRSLRISVGWSSTEADVLAATGALEEVLGELRALGTAC